jgi:hypothetical protein
MGETAIGDGAVDNAVAAFPGLKQNAAGEEQRISGGVDDRVAGAAHALRAVHVVEARRMHVQPHVPVRGVDEHVVGAAGELDMTLRLELGGGSVVGCLVGANYVVAVMDKHVAGEGDDVAGLLLLFRVQIDGNAPGRQGFRLRNGHQLLAGIVGERGLRPGLLGARDSLLILLAGG